MASSPLRFRWFQHHLGAFGVTAVLGLFGVAGAAPQCAPPPPAPVVQVAGVQDAVVASVNQYRATAGLAPVTIDARLTGAAQSHANDMAQRKLLTHTGADGSNAGARITAQGYGWTTWAENAAAGQPTPADVMSSWINSPGHAANMRNGAMVNIGVAAAQGSNGVTYWVMVLAA
jgi:uncharacterized protein YkwD